MYRCISRRALTVISHCKQPPLCIGQHICSQLRLIEKKNWQHSLGRRKRPESCNAPNRPCSSDFSRDHELHFPAGSPQFFPYLDNQANDVMPPLLSFYNLLFPFRQRAALLPRQSPIGKPAERPRFGQDFDEVSPQVRLDALLLR